MNRMQKMGIDLNTVEGLTKIISIKCVDLDDGYGTKGNCKYPKNKSDICIKCKAERLLEEIPTKKVPRGCTYTDFKKAWCDFVNDVGSGGGFVDWLSAEIEVEADD